jgi:hypothetical protein
VPHELAEMRFDAGGLRKTDEMRDYGHATAGSARGRAHPEARRTAQAES